MNATVQDNILLITLAERIDSNNAAAEETAIFDALRTRADMRVVFDAADLTYISSAGLRVLMKVRKLLGYPPEIRHVSRDVYDIFETTGFTELLDVKKAYRRISVDGLEVIASGFFGTVYRIDEDSIVKVYRGKESSIPMIENEKRMAQRAFLSGIPTAISYDIVQVGEEYGSVFEMLHARTFHELVQKEEMPVGEIIAKYAALLRQVHGTRMAAGEFPSYRERYLEYVDTVQKHLTAAQYEALRKLILRMPEEATVIHGDIQMKNVMLVGGEAMLIDMDTLGLGDPVFEFAGLYVAYQSFAEDEPDNSLKFLGMLNIPGR